MDAMSAPTSSHAPTYPPRSRPGEPAWAVATLFPNQGQWSESDYLALGTNRLVELCDGCLEVLPMPTRLHQLIVKFLFLALDAFVKPRDLGEVHFAPLPIRLWEGRFREPDVVFLRPERLGDPRQPVRGADLVVEVVSEGPEDRRRDLVDKRHEYARAGIAEYWMVDPQEQLITVLYLAGTDYQVHGEFGPGAVATSRLLDGFCVAATDVFAAGRGTGPNRP
jgi:Uma2 family endonuclease